MFKIACIPYNISKNKINFISFQISKTIIERAVVIEMVRLGYRYKARQTFFL
jgi:hypothetical protein